ncbi:hypothetical protein AB0L05_38115, partial [Nonomuraea pusilla]
PSRRSSATSTPPSTRARPTSPRTPNLFRRIGVARRPTNPNPAARSFLAYLRTASAQLRNSMEPSLR